MNMNAIAPSSIAPAAAALPSDPKPQNPEEAARQFEALLIAQMLRSARESSSGGKLGSAEDGGNESDTMMDLAEQQFAKLMAQNGGLGLTRLMVQGLTAPPPVGPGRLEGH